MKQPSFKTGLLALILGIIIGGLFTAVVSMVVRNLLFYELGDLVNGFIWGVSARDVSRGINEYFDSEDSDPNNTSAV